MASPFRKGSNQRTMAESSASRRSDSSARTWNDGPDINRLRPLLMPTAVCDGNRGLETSDIPTKPALIAFPEILSRFVADDPPCSALVDLFSMTRVGVVKALSG